MTDFGGYSHLISPEPMSGCWLWIGADDAQGYGTVTLAGKTLKAHRAVYLGVGKSIPPGKELDHRCRVRCCVNPEHLEPVSHRENVLRGEGIAAKNARKTHCPSGHEYSGDNVFIRKRGGRGCRICQRSAALAYSRRVAPPIKSQAEVSSIRRAAAFRGWKMRRGNDTDQDLADEVEALAREAEALAQKLRAARGGR